MEPKRRPQGKSDALPEHKSSSTVVTARSGFRQSRRPCSPTGHSISSNRVLVQEQQPSPRQLIERRPPRDARRRSNALRSQWILSLVAQAILISRRSSEAKIDFGMSACTPRTMSTTWVTRKLTAILHRA